MVIVASLLRYVSNGYSVWQGILEMQRGFLKAFKSPYLSVFLLSFSPIGCKEPNALAPASREGYISRFSTQYFSGVLS
jgi:hypothetical protein